MWIPIVKHFTADTKTCICYKLVQGFRVTCLFTCQYNTKGYDMIIDVKYSCWLDQLLLGWIEVSLLPQSLVWFLGFGCNHSLLFFVQYSRHHIETRQIIFAIECCVLVRTLYKPNNKILIMIWYYGIFSNCPPWIWCSDPVRRKKERGDTHDQLNYQMMHSLTIERWKRKIRKQLADRVKNRQL